MRVRAVGVGIAAAIGLFVLGMIFGLNGEQWEWWRWAAWAGAVLVLIATVFRLVLRVGLTSGGEGSARLAGGLLGATLGAVSVLLMADRYSDPYSGALLWPHTLAIVAFVGFALVVLSVALRAAGSERRV